MSVIMTLWKIKPHLVERLDPKLVDINTGLVLSLSVPHAPGVFEVLCLVLPGLAQVHDDLRGPGIQGVEVGSVILVQTLCGEVINAPQSVHQLPKVNFNEIKIKQEKLMMTNV